MNPSKATNLLRNYPIYTFGKAISLLIGLSILPLYMNVLPKDQFGIIGILWVVIPLLTRLTNLGIDVGITVNFFKLDHNQLCSSLYNGLFTISFISLFLLLFGLTFFNLIHLLLGKEINRLMFTLIIVSCYFSNFHSITLSFLQNRGKAFSNVFLTILPPFILGIAAYVLALLWKKDFTTYIWSLFLSNTICFVISAFYLFKNYSLFLFRFSLNAISNLLKIGLPTIPGLLFNTILASGDRYMIRFYLGIEAVAVYTLGYRFSEQISQAIFQPFLKTMTPAVFEIAKTNITNARVYSINILKNILIIMILVVATGTIFINDVINLLGSGNYYEAYGIFLVSVVGILLWTASSCETTILIFLEKTGLIMFTISIAAGLNILLNFLFIPKLGLMGAAITTVLSYLFLIFLRGKFLSKLTGRSFHFGIILRVLPFCVFLILIFFIDYSNFSVLTKYTLKLPCLIVLPILYILLFPSFRKSMYSFYTNYLLKRFASVEIQVK